MLKSHSGSHSFLICDARRHLFGGLKHKINTQDVEWPVGQTLFVEGEIAGISGE